MSFVRFNVFCGRPRAESCTIQHRDLISYLLSFFSEQGTLIVKYIHISKIIEHKLFSNDRPQDF